MLEKYELIGYANRVGSQLENFKQKKPRLWEFSHTCEAKHGTKRKKTRAYIYEPTSGNSLNVKCQHCGYSASLLNFIKDVSPSLHDEIRFSAYKEKKQQTPLPVLTSEKTRELHEVAYDTNLTGLVPVTSLPKSSSVIKFLQRRVIPVKHYGLFYVAKNFYSWATQFKPEFADSKDDSPRLILPYFDLHGRVIGFTGRSFSPAAQKRYIHLRIDTRTDFIYGTERIDPSKTIYVTEGQIDSLFVDNAIAVGGANYSTPFMASIKTNCVIIPDSDWKRNSQVGKQLKKTITAGFAVSFIPDHIKGKDLNDIVKNGVNTDELMKIIKQNTKTGLSAQLEYSLLKKF